MSLEVRLKEQYNDNRILTIQSHVVHGYAGNKCSVFPLQLHGFDVDIINSVQFSNHTGYKEGVRGYRLAAKDLAALYEGLKINNINQYSHIMSGYCGDLSFLQQICTIVKDVKQGNSNLLYICDPVLGDNGHYYVPKELCTVYRDEILPLADIITPNVFELSELSGISVKTECECLEAIRHLHRIHPHLQLIVATSGIFAEGRTDLFYCYASQRITNPKNKDKQDGAALEFDQSSVFRFEIPVIEGQYVGTGDVFTSLLVAWLTKTDGDVATTIRHVISSLQSLLKRTHSAAFSGLNDGEKPIASKKELRLVQSRFELLMPNEEVKFVKLS